MNCVDSQLVITCTGRVACMVTTTSLFELFMCTIKCSCVGVEIYY